MRNVTGLSEEQIEQAKAMWDFITQVDESEENHFEISVLNLLNVQLDTSSAHIDNSTTAFLEATNTVRLGADAYPTTGNSISANDILSPLACLCHEYAHAVRYHIGFRRPFNGALMHLDEAETSIHASYEACLYPMDRERLVEDALERISNWKNEI